MTISIAVATKNAELNSYAANFNSGNLVIYAGTPPATADTALSSNPILATLPFSATAFATASGGSITANAITQANATGTGTATFYRAFTSGAACIEQGTCGVGTGDLQMNNVTLVTAGPTQVTSFVRSM